MEKGCFFYTIIHENSLNEKIIELEFDQKQFSNRNGVN